MAGEFDRVLGQPLCPAQRHQRLPGPAPGHAPSYDRGRATCLSDATNASLIQQDPSLHHTLMPQAPRASTPTEVLAGLVDRVTFHNAENGFCVLRVKARGERDLITVLG